MKHNPRTAQLKGCGFHFRPFHPFYLIVHPLPASTTPRAVSTKLNKTSPFAGKRHTKRSAPPEVHTPWNKAGKPIDFGVKRSAGDFRECGIFKTGAQRICRRSPGGGLGGAPRAKGTAGAKDRGMKGHHSASQQGGRQQTTSVGQFPV